MDLFSFIQNLQKGNIKDDSFSTYRFDDIDVSNYIDTFKCDVSLMSQNELYFKSFQYLCENLFGRGRLVNIDFFKQNFKFSYYCFIYNSPDVMPACRCYYETLEGDKISIYLM